MSRALILLLSFVAVSAEARPLWNLGMAMEARLEREVNPEYTDPAGLGQVFAQVEMGRWLAHAEIGRQEQESSSGSLAVKTTTNIFGLWGRYQFLNEKKWRPFLGAGMGMHLDEVKTSYGATSKDRRDGERGYLGIGGGVGRVFAEWMLIEVEVRAGGVEDRKDPLFSLTTRLGVQI